MNFVKERLKQFAFPVVAITVMSIILFFVFYFILSGLTGFNMFSDEPSEKKLDAITKILGVSIAVTGFISIVLTIIQSRESIKRGLQESSIGLFKELRSQPFKEARIRCWIVKHKWYNEPGYKERLLDNNFADQNGKLKQTDKKLHKDMSAAYELMEFYLLLSTYKGNEDILKQFRYFYYGWWRHFLYDFAYEVERRRKLTTELPTETINQYVKDISYSETLARLDELCGFQQINKKIHLHKDGG